MPDFRPVQEVWGMYSARFLSTDMTVSVLEAICGRLGSKFISRPYGDLTSVWIEFGEGFLDCLETGRYGMKDFLRDFADAFWENGEEDTPENAASLLENLRLFAPIWRSSLDVRDWSLRFYID